MKTAIKVFSIIGLALNGFALLSCMGDSTDVGYVIMEAMLWVPLCILSLIYVQDKK